MTNSIPKFSTKNKMKYIFFIELMSILFVCSFAHESNDQESQIEHRPRAIAKDTFSQTIDEPSSGTFVMYYGKLD